MNQREEINGTSSKGEEMTLTWKQRGMSIIVSNVPETLFDDYDVKVGGSIPKHHIRASCMEKIGFQENVVVAFTTCSFVKTWKLHPS